MSKRLDLENFIPFRLNRLSSEVSRRLGGVYGEKFGIDVPQWRVIATLGGSPDAVLARDIAEQTRMHKSIVSRAVSRLIERGWIERQTGGQDRREAPLQFTASGRMIYGEIVPIVLEFEQKLLEKLDDADKNALSRLFSHLEQQLGVTRS